MILVSLLVIFTVASTATSHWHIKGEYVCLEAAKNTTYDPLCASNGQTYQNLITFQCFVRYFDVYGLSVRRGACYGMPEPDHCVLAFVIWRRVCGTDNVTYSSVWELMCEAQRQNKWNIVQYEGPCRVQCPMTLQYKPVCSSENVDYPNLEALRCSALRKSHNNITLKKEGLCFNKDMPTSICQPPKYGGETERQNPICASNGVTYSSYNALACLRLYNHDIRILHDGPCQYRDVVIPAEEKKVCHFADNNAILMPVCGTDNVTYPNPFVLHCAIYRGIISEEVEVQHEGSCENISKDGDIAEYEEDPCQEQKEAPAHSMINKPLFCASDGRSYYSAKQYACAVKMNSNWYHYYIIRVGVSCEQSDGPCEKLHVLPEALVSDPICGSDGISYANPLALMCAMTTEPKLKKHHKGPCIPS